MVNQIGKSLFLVTLERADFLYETLYAQWDSCYNERLIATNHGLAGYCVNIA